MFSSRDHRVARLIRRTLRMCAVARNGRGCWQAKRDLNSHYTVWSRACCRCTIGLLAAEPGFEPGQRRSERRVLPLHNPARLVGAAGFEPAISPVRGADVAQATPHAEIRFHQNQWSGRKDSNLRSPRSKRGMLAAAPHPEDPKSLLLLGRLALTRRQ